MIEIGISIVAIVAIIYGGMSGAKEGLFRAFARLCLGILGAIIAMRFWYLGTDFLAAQLSVSQEQVSFAAFWGIFALCVIPFLIGIKTLNHEFIPVYPIPVERFVGFLFGAINGGVLASAMLMSLALNLPTVLPNYNETRLLLPIHRVPALVYRQVESRLSSAAPISRTLLPASERTTPQSPLEVRWK